MLNARLASVLCFISILLVMACELLLAWLYHRYAGTWSDKYKDKGQGKRFVSTTNQLSSSRDFFGDFMVWRPPVGLEKNPAFWTLLAFWIGLVGTAFLLQR